MDKLFILVILLVVLYICVLFIAQNIFKILSKDKNWEDEDTDQLNKE